MIGRTRFLVTVLAAMIGGSAGAAAPPATPLMEGRELNPVVRDFYLADPPLTEVQPAQSQPGKLDPDAALAVLLRLLFPLQPR